MKPLRLLWFTLGVLCLFSPVARAEDHPAINPEDLKMTADPVAPGASAIILYRQVDRDDRQDATHEMNFVRIKILKEEGRKYADVEIPYDKGSSTNIVNIQARTIHRDGSVSEFTSKPFDKSVVKARGLRYMAKTFTLPDVQVGSVIEYSYTLILPDGALYDSHWILSDELFTRDAKFSLKPYSSPYSGVRVRWSWHRLPPGTAEPQAGKDNVIRLEAQNIPAFQTEDYMPPENELKSRVDFTYTSDPEMDSAKYWKNRDKEFNGAVESFAGKRKAMESAVAEIVSPNDGPEVKLQKIYERVQKMRNLSYEQSKTLQEEKREKQKDNSNVEDVWKHGYGYGRELNWLFFALVKAAGFDAHVVFASDRSRYFFDPAYLDAQKLNTDLVIVKLNDADIFCDPGAEFTPFGLLMWSETAIQGLQVDNEGGAWLKTMTPKSSASRTINKAELTLSDTGDLEGKLSVTFTGLKAMELRTDERNEDEADRKKTLEDAVKADVPTSSEVELTNKPDWTNSSTPLVAEFKFKVEQWASPAGRKLMLPLGLFSAGERKLFEHQERIHPIYFHYPSEQDDDIVVTLPTGWHAVSLPKEVSLDQQVIVYSMKAEDNKSSLRIRRSLSIDVLYMLQKYYPALRNFFQNVRTTDEEQVLLQPASTTASN